ncbi:bifunctional folylpolyglutamate synthase/dihydrofolate synthase [Citricoccus sp. GCM10030269]|uniref:bifunctional folylpolyglutamate synthase/dihydrofolate synthase n=1 Tax=Citricoccus sp. GCM10030269 TaxID=3273388 RepID=UPI0036098A8D
MSQKNSSATGSTADDNGASLPSGGPETVEAVYQDLLARAPENKMEPRMGPMWRAMELLGEPQKSAPVIHLTGTNGKTSTARIIESVLRAYGLRTGRYTSPHLSSVTERISIDGAPVPQETFVRIWNEILPVVQVIDAELEAAGKNPLTYFEAVTVLGFAIFADEPVDVVVLEVGLGGITDATNVADGAVSVVTPISLDHSDLLGDTEAEIAEEKAGIIKPGGFLVSAAQDPDAAQVLLDAARAVDAGFRFEGVDFGVESRSVAVGGQQVTVRGIAGRYPGLTLPLHGEHQAENLAVAIVALEAFFGGEKELESELLHQGLAEVSAPGRLEVVRSAPTIVVDAAHNPAGIKATASALQEAFGFEKLVLVVGILQEKDSLEMLTELYREFGDLVEDLCLTQSDSPRAIPAGELAQTALDAGWPEDDLFATESIPDAIEWAVGRAENAGTTDDGAAGIGGGVLITGSVTLVAEARDLLGAPEAGSGQPGTPDVVAVPPALDVLQDFGLELGDGLDEEPDEEDIFDDDIDDGVDDGLDDGDDQRGSRDS